MKTIWYFIPNISEKLRYSTKTEVDNNETKTIKKKQTAALSNEENYGIFDWAKTNHRFKCLLSHFKINYISNKDIHKEIMDSWSSQTI